MGEVVQSVKNPVVKARVFAIKYLYIKGEEGGGIRSRAGQKAEQQVVKTEEQSVNPAVRAITSIGTSVSFPSRKAHVHASAYHGTVLGPMGLIKCHGVKEGPWSLPRSWEKPSAAVHLLQRVFPLMMSRIAAGIWDWEDGVGCRAGQQTVLQGQQKQLRKKKLS